MAWWNEWNALSSFNKEPEPEPEVVPTFTDKLASKGFQYNETHYGETAGDEPAKTYEKNRQQFKIVDLVSPSWTIQVPVRKNK